MRRRRRAVVAVVLSFALVGAACGGDDDSGGSGSATTSGGEADRDGTLRVAASAAPTQWDPHQGRSAVVDYSLMGPIYDRLLLLEPDMSIGPMLAESYEMAEDNRSMTLSLRDDVVFHDGTPFDAEAVKVNLDYTRSLDSFYAGVAGIVENVVVVDPHTVRIDFNEDGTNFPLALAFYTGVGGMVSPAALGDPDTLATTPSGSGPYRLVEQQQDRAVYERVPDYWDEEIDARAPQRLEIVSIPDDNARVAALQSGQIDASVVINPVANLESITAGGDILVQEFPNNRLIQVMLNHSDPALADPDVRRALSMAIDREALAENVVQGTCTPSAQAAGEGGAGYSEDAGFVHDPEAAEELLADAGATDLSFSAEVVSSPLFQNLGVALQAQWEEIGVDVDLTPIPGAESLAEWRSGEYQMYVQTASGFPDPGQSIEDYFVSTNMPHGTDPELERMHEAAKVLPLGSDERDAAYAEINAYMAETPVNVIVCTWPVQVLHTPRVGGVEDVSMTRLQTAWDTRNLYVVSG